MRGGRLEIAVVDVKVPWGLASLEGERGLRSALNDRTSLLE